MRKYRKLGAPNLTLSAEQINQLLAEQDLLISAPNYDGQLEGLAYNSQKVTENSLLFIKGRFKAAYLADAVERGLSALVVPTGFDLSTDLPVWVVKDVPAAMSILAMAFYDYPQDQLKLIGITGTKGKTSTTYMAYEMLKLATNDHVALSSTLEVITGNEPENHYRAHLTTPESLDLFAWMREAVNNGMQAMVMEVSSQAYKMERVFGLRFDVGIFLNISPDHVGENEHPTFADYLECKMQLLDHSDQVIINADSDHFVELIERAELDHSRDAIWLYAREDEDGNQADVAYQTVSADLRRSTFAVLENNQQARRLGIAGEYELDIPGDFNQGNAVAAMMATRILGTDSSAMKEALLTVKVPGRMEVLTSKVHGTVYVDYAHNYASIAALLNFAKANSQEGQVQIVVGATGNKGVSRRPGIGKAVNQAADVVYLTADDPQFEDPAVIADEIQLELTNPKLKIIREMDRVTAITKAIAAAGPTDVTVLAGKGMDEYQKINGVDTPYENDLAIAQRLLGNA